MVGTHEGIKNQIRHMMTTDKTYDDNHGEAITWNPTHTKVNITSESTAAFGEGTSELSQ
jgi:hypothetical protein